MEQVQSHRDLEAMLLAEMCYPTRANFPGKSGSD
jgi:hypothetical protein